MRDPKASRSNLLDARSQNGHNEPVPAIGRFRYLEALPRPESGRRRGTLVLLHAFPLNARMWEPQLTLAAHGWHVIAPHVRGVDSGDADPPTVSMDDYTADLIDLMDALHVDEAVIGGLSMGGYLALSLVRRAPNYIRALVLADTRSQADTPEGLDGRRRMLKLVEEKGPAAVADEMIPKLLGAHTRTTRPDIEERVRALILANSTASIAGAVRALMTRADSTPLLASIRVPTLIVVGEEDTLTPPSSAEDMHSRIRSSEIAHIAEAGHLASLEQPDAFNSVLARFLDHRV
jgi:pimeloyl-ACP methyl ester carboxylesterase